jgi:hypothetical protein
MSTTDQIFYARQILEKSGSTVHQLFIQFKKAYNSVRIEVSYNILIEFGIPRKLGGLIKIRLNETYSTVRMGKNLSNQFPIQNGPHKETLCHHCFSTLLWNMPLGGYKRTRAD